MHIMADAFSTQYGIVLDDDAGHCLGEYIFSTSVLRY